MKLSKNSVTVGGVPECLLPTRLMILLFFGCSEWTTRGSNPPSPDCKTGVTPLRLLAHTPTEDYDTPTLRLTGVCSAPELSRLKYGRWESNPQTSWSLDPKSSLCSIRVRPHSIFSFESGIPDSNGSPSVYKTAARTSCADAH